MTIPLTPLIGTAHQRGLFFASSQMTLTRMTPDPLGPPASVSDQVTRLRQRGLSFPDPGRAAHFLSNINLYHIRGYLEPFIDQTASVNPRPFLTNASFDSVIERYDFDKALRILLLEAFSHIEVSIRTQWTYHLAYTRQGGELAHLDPTLFSQDYYRNLVGLYRDYQRHGNRAHLYDFSICPIWAIAEAMSFGQMSRWYGDTNRQVRRLVANHYGLDERILRTLLRHLAPIRSFCAHHERLWDRDFITKLTVPTRMGAFANPGSFFNRGNNIKLYNSLVMIAHLTRVITGSAEWPLRLVALIDQYQNIPVNEMGFVPGWQSLDIWK